MPSEYIGIIASLVVIVAFGVKGEKKIRILDMIGAFLYVIYGLSIHSFSNVFLNLVLLGVNIYRLIKG